MNLVLRNVLDIDPAAQMRLRELRNQDAVRKYMYSDHVIGEKEHRHWLERLPKKPFYRVFAVYLDDAVVGALILSEINQAHKRADWAFYIDADLHGRGIGSALERKALDLVFNELGLEKLNCEVLESNPAVIALHKKFGFAVEGVRREHVIRNGQKFGTVLLGITKREWLENQHVVR